MEEPKRIVLILGNGFDIDLGLKTSYKDFWQSDYCPKDYPAPLIKYLNECWGDDLGKVRWYDLENAFMAYYQKITSPEGPFDVITETERDFLKEINSAYIIGESYFEKDIPMLQSLQSKGILKRICEKNGYIHNDIPFLEDLKKSPIIRDREAFKRINEGICQYIGELKSDGTNDSNLASFVLSALSIASELDFVNIYSFNYTELPEDFKSIFEKSTYHVHGRCAQKNIIVGTGDSEEFNTNYDYLQKAYSPYFNPPALVPNLLAADDVIIFGHSIGENDRQYFDAFFKQQTASATPKRINITVFTYDEQSELDIKRALQRMTGSKLSVLCSQNNVRIIKKSEVTRDPNPFLDFLKEYIPDNDNRRPLEQRFLSAQIE